MNERELINGFHKFFNKTVKEAEYVESALNLCDLLDEMIEQIGDESNSKHTLIEWVNSLQLNATNLKPLKKKSRRSNVASVKEEIKEMEEAVQNIFTEFKYSDIYKRFKAKTQEVSTAEGPSARPQEPRVQYQDIGIFDKLAESASRYRMVIKVDIQSQEAYLIPHDENIDRHEQLENKSSRLRIVNERD
ncbi:MAG: hypothetical protein ACR2NW_02950 [Thermodesulfobacteriota bacterium]